MPRSTTPVLTGPPADRTADCTHSLGRALAGYVEAIADLLGVPAEGTTWEVTDTATAYLALTGRSPDHPGREVMLVWAESRGWAVSIETAPGEPPIVLARSGAVVPPPAEVARLVADSLARRAPARCARPARLSRPALAERLHRHS
ncbi:DUF6292 family protein [Actinokineospora sp. NPDC004072]